MKTFKIQQCLYALWLLVIVGCSRNTIEVAERNFEQEIETQQNLVFRFNQNVAQDSLFNLWDTVQYVRIQPAVKGKFRWTAANELTFSPEVGFAAGTDYTATLTPLLSQLASSAEGSFSVSNDDIKFHTPYLQLSSSDIFWNRTESGSIELRFNLNFNYKVNPTDVISLLNISIGNQEIKPELKSSAIGEVVEVSVPLKNANTDEADVVIEVKKGLKCAESSHITSDKITLETKVPSRSNFQITQVLTEYEGEKGFLHVYANQALDLSNAQRNISFEPAVNFTIEPLEYGFNIKGNFSPAVNYELTILQGLRGVFGGNLSKEHQQFVVFGQPEPDINFTEAKAIYLSSKGEKNVAVSIVGVPKVNVVLYKIYENNILNYMRNSGLEYNGSEYYDSYGSFEEFGDVVFSREIPTKSLKKDANGQRLINLDFIDNNSFKGIYVLKVSDAASQYVGAQRTLSVSDIGLIARETENRIVVFANSLVTAKPLKNVEVSLISSNNQQIYKANTDDKGVAIFDNIRRKAPGFKTKMLAAKYENEFTYMHFGQTATQTSRYEVDGLYENPSGYQAFIYGDRDIYRPGETMHFNVILRNNQWTAPAKMPVKFRVLLPNGRELLAKRGELNEEGAFATDVKLSDAAVTGTYNVEILTGNDLILNTKAISVEEFMPDRIKVNVSLDKETLRPSEQLTLQGTALNLFGPPAANRNYQTELTISRENFSPKGYENYKFDIEGVSGSYNAQYYEGKTDENGQFRQNFNCPADYANNGMLKGRIYTTVFDENGRPVNRISTVKIPTQSVFAGIKYFDSYVDVKQPIQIPLITLTEAGTPTSATLNVAVVQYEWHSVAQQSYSGSGFRYVSQRREKLIHTRSVATNKGGSAFSFIPQTSGEYEIRVYNDGSDKYVAQGFYAYGWGYTSNTSFEVNKEGNIEIAFDKESYEIGETAEVLFKTPFAGKMLVTVERNQLFEHFWLDTDKKSAKLSLPIAGNYLPNIYVTATLFRPLDDGSMPLTVGHGYKSIRVTDPETVLPLEILASAKAKSNSKQTITVKTTSRNKSVELTIAVVDEGILQLKNYKTPNPHEFFFQKRALQVRGYDMYAVVFPNLKAAKSKVGGDGYDLSRRVNPLTNKRVKLMAYWSGTLKTNDDGEAKYTIDIPQFSGELRIMAVAYRGKAFGSAEKPMKVADDLVVSSSIPRFLSPADELVMPVTLSNTTNRAATFAVSLNTKGAVSIADGQSATSVNIAANSEQQVLFKVKAAQQMGEGVITVTAKGSGQTFTEQTNITVRPSASLTKIYESGVLAGGQNTTLNMGANFMPQSAQASLLVSRSPLVQFAENLNSLLQYPHGCVEQTISAAFPQLYFHEMAKTLYLKNPKAFAAMPSSNPNFNIQEAINKLQTMQLYDGGLSYWPGSEYESWWGSAYGAHFLLEARNAGFEVNSAALDKLFNYLAQKSKEKALEKYVYYDGNNARYVKEIAPKEIAYSLYVLALAGKAEVATMNYYKANKSLLSLDCQYLLATAYLRASDQNSYHALVPSSFANERASSSNAGSFYSYIRDEAIALNALLDTDPNNPQIPTMAKHLSQELKRERYLSTQENAFALLALGKIAKKAAASNATAAVSAAGNNLGSFTGKDAWFSKGLVGTALNINASGKGNVYYFGEASGIPADGVVKQEDSFLRVRRTFFDRNGSQLNGTTFRQNDLVVVRVSIATTDQTTVDNIVITDMLPAGFEPENGRLSNANEMTWIRGAATPDHLDIRDDRINIFTSAAGTERHFYYQVRAVSRGKFNMGNVSADAMYDGEYHSYHGANTIEIVERDSGLMP